jgi:arginase
MNRYAIVEAPSILGLKPTGVDRLPAALLQHGLADELHARRAGRVAPKLRTTPSAIQQRSL